MGIVTPCPRDERQPMDLLVVHPGPSHYQSHGTSYGMYGDISRDVWGDPTGCMGSHTGCMGSHELPMGMGCIVPYGVTWGEKPLMGDPTPHSVGYMRPHGMDDLP